VLGVCAGVVMEKIKKNNESNIEEEHLLKIAYS
jgi:hypothetical protein